MGAEWAELRVSIGTGAGVGVPEPPGSGPWEGMCHSGLPLSPAQAPFMWLLALCSFPRRNGT